MAWAISSVLIQSSNRFRLPSLRMGLFYPERARYTSAMTPPSGSTPFAAGDTIPGISQIVTSQDHWYVNFTSQADMEHNNHLVIAWVIMTDNKTVVPLISSPDNQRDIIQAQTYSPDYVILNAYSQCPACVRPADVGVL